MVILGRRAATTEPTRISLDIEADLGSRTWFHGRGLDTRLAGSVRLRGDTRTPLRFSGSIATREGTYDTYGQSLAIDRGIVNFQGPIETAGLNVLALRKGGAVEAGVEVSGSVIDPRVRLVSDPNVPDAEKLSWLVLGHGQDQAGGSDSAVLLTAASAILGGSSGGMTKQLAQGLGLDQISVGSGSATASTLPLSTVAGSATSGGSGARDGALSSQIVTIGKRLSSKAFLSYEQSLNGLSSGVKLTYSLTRGLSVIGRAGTDNSLGLFYTFAFD